ncbi:hypothetical protein [Marinobacter sp.]|uniref:hypothetical protein n=1 Tax=Marinobacter sp. TaxID=50741 RepID=UPI00384EF82D
MTHQTHYQAQLAQSSVNPSLLCGHCNSILSPSKIFRNPGDRDFDGSCAVIGLCSADDCGSVNCCDDALSRVDNPSRIVDLAS